MGRHLILPIPTYPQLLFSLISSSDGTRTHRHFCPRDFKQDNFIYLGLSHHHAFLFRCRALNPVIKKINFPGSLYTFLKFTLGLARPPDFSFSRIHPICIIYFYVMGTMALFHSPSLVSTVSPPSQATKMISSIRNSRLLNIL